MHHRTRISLFVLIAIVILFVLAVMLPFQIAPDNRDHWLAEHRIAQLISEPEPEDIRLADTYTDGSLEVQLWQISAGGRQYYDAVVWQRSLLGRYRVIHTEWVPLEETENWWMSFGFRCGFYWYHFDVTRTTSKLSTPDKTFRIW